MQHIPKIRNLRPLGPKGLTLVELLVALVLTAIVGAALYQGLINQSKNFYLQDQMAEAQQNARIAMDAILKDLRSAGYGMGYIAKDADQTPVNDQGVLFGTRQLPTTINIVTNNDSSHNGADVLYIRRGDSKPWSILKFQPHPHRGEWWMLFIDVDPDLVFVPFVVNDFVLIMNADKREFRAMKVMEKGRTVVGDPVPPNKTKISLWAYPNAFFSDCGICANGDNDERKCKTSGYTNYTGGTVTKLLEVAYYIQNVYDNALGADVPCLMKSVNDQTAQLVARGIEDLQIAYQDAAGTWYRDGTKGSDPPTPGNVRNVRLNLVARARVPSSNTYHFVEALEDGSRHPRDGSDSYPRRVLTTQVKIRNYGID